MVAFVFFFGFEVYSPSTSESNINLVNDIMLKNIDIIDESCDINDFLNCNERIQDMQFFKKLIQKII